MGEKKKGFTLVEFIIVIAIIGVLSSVALYSLTTSRENTNLRNAQREVSSAIGLAKSYALQGVTVSGSGTPCGYGFRFISNQSYEIFYIKPASGSSCSDFVYAGCYASGNNCVRLEEFSLGGNVRIREAVENSEIYFAVPHGAAYQESGAAFSTRVLTFETASGSADKAITINSSGSVTEE